MVDLEHYFVISYTLIFGTKLNIILNEKKKKDKKICSYITTKKKMPNNDT